ncbi:PP2C-domain-containing protein [Peniophora sp. CONT]|nr:PP2C-domain-containing protein [Peniophora sp. CONT]
MQGWRITMEDAHTTTLKLKDGEGEEDDGNSFFAVYDGHGGGAVARFAGQNVHKRLIKEEAYRSQDWKEAMRRAFLGTDEDMLADPAYTREPSGCTAVATLITKDGRIFCANAGDSRSVMSVKGEVKALSHDHKPQNQTERTRVVNAGGYIEFGRVNGNLALARALGDFEYKKNYSIAPEAQIITANPDVIEHKITEEDEFVVIACDGIWDCLSSQQVVNIVRLQVAEGKPLSEICENLCELCLAPDTTSGAGIGCDNMTAMIVALLNGKTKEEWYAMIKDRVQNHYGYNTPDALPQIYATNRLISFRARREAMDRNRDTMAGHPLGGLARVLGGSGISFHPGTGVVSDGGTLVYEENDSEDDDEHMDTEGDEYYGAHADAGSGLDGAAPPDLTKSLKEQLEELERDDAELRFEDAADEEDAFKEPFDSVIDLSDAEKTRAEVAADRESASAGGDAKQGEAPPPPLTNGDASMDVPKQLTSTPGGDAPSDSVKAEGLLDKSEDPLKA